MNGSEHKKNHPETAAARATVHSMPPLECEKPHILILGSMPGAESLRKQQYYAKKDNRFWGIIAVLASEMPSDDYEMRKQLLRGLGIALWDVLETAERIGSLDSSIRSAVPNDIRAFLKKYPTIVKIGFNGRKAETEFKKHFPDLYAEYECIPLRSTSPANRQFSDREMLECWKSIL